MPNVFDNISTGIPTTTGNQDIVGDLGGVTPKLALFYWDNYEDVISPTPERIDHEILGQGATDGTNQISFCIRTTDNLPTSDTRRIGSASHCIKVIDPITATSLEEASFVSFIPNGIRINWASVDAGTSRKVICVLMGGDLSAHVNKVGLGSSAQTINVTDPGFQPEVITTLGIQDSFDNVVKSAALWQTGIAWDNGISVSQRCLAWEDDNNATTVRRDVRRINNVAFRPVNGQNATITNLNSSGFDVVTSGSFSGDDMGYVAINFAGQAFNVGDWTTPTSVGNHSKTGVTFEPDLVIIHGSSIETPNSIDASSESGGYGIGVFNVNGNHAALATFGQDAVTVSNSASAFDESLAYMSGTENADFTIKAQYQSMDSDGFTLNHLQAHPSTTYGHFLAVSSDVVATRVTQQYVENVLIPAPPNAVRVTQHYLEHIRTWLEPQIITPGSRTLNIDK